MLSEVSSLDDLFSWERLLQLLAIACMALVPGALIRRLSKRRLKLDAQLPNGLIPEKKVQWFVVGISFFLRFTLLWCSTCGDSLYLECFIFIGATWRWGAFRKTKLKLCDLCCVSVGTAYSVCIYMYKCTVTLWTLSYNNSTVSVSVAISSARHAARLPPNRFGKVHVNTTVCQCLSWLEGLNDYFICRWNTDCLQYILYNLEVVVILFDNCISQFVYRTRTVSILFNWAVTFKSFRIWTAVVTCEFVNLDCHSLLNCALILLL